MSRPERPADRLTEAEARELEQLDRVLALGPAAAELGGEDARLAGLVLAVRDDRPALRPAFAEGLDARRAAGFPRRGPAAGPAGGARRRRPETRHWIGGLAAAATVAVVAVLAIGNARPASQPAVSARGPQPGLAPPSPGAASSASPAPSLAAPASPAPSHAAPPSPAPSLVAPPSPVPSAGAGAARAVEREATLALLASRGQVQQVTDRAIAATDRLGGIVTSSNVALDDQGGSQASLELQVPSAALDRALAVLSGLAHVSSRAQSTLDITDATGTARARLAEARAERNALLRQLARATTANGVASIHAQLAAVNGRIASDQAQAAALSRRAQFAHLSVTIGEDRQAGASSAWGPGAALDDALAVLEGVFSVLVVALAGLVPAGVLAALAWWAPRPLRRRRRERILAAPTVR